MNAAKFLHTRVEFFKKGTTDVKFGWVTNLRSLEVCITLPGGAKTLLEGSYVVRMASESASTEFESNIVRSSGDQIWFKLPVPFRIAEGKDNARVQVRGQYASVRTSEFDFIAELEDLSLTGMAFLIPMVCEPEEMLRVHLPRMLSTGDLRCEVRYCVKVGENPDLYRVGAKFLALSPEQGKIVRDMMLSPISRAS